MKSIFVVVAIIAVVMSGGVNINTPWGGGSINWKRQAEAEDLGIGDWLGCAGAAVGAGVACTVGEVATFGADTAVCVGAGLGAGGACASAFGALMDEDNPLIHGNALLDLGGIKVNTPWGGGSIKWKRVNADLM